MLCHMISVFNCLLYFCSRILQSSNIVKWHCRFQIYQKVCFYTISFFSRNFYCIVCLFVAWVTLSWAGWKSQKVCRGADGYCRIVTWRALEVANLPTVGLLSKSVFLLRMGLILNFHFVSGGGFCLKGNRAGWVWATFHCWYQNMPDSQYLEGADTKDWKK